jgi:hypothetical protein
MIIPDCAGESQDISAKMTNKYFTFDTSSAGKAMIFADETIP